MKSRAVQRVDEAPGIKNFSGALTIQGMSVIPSKSFSSNSRSSLEIADIPGILSRLGISKAEEKNEIAILNLSMTEKSYSPDVIEELGMRYEWCPIENGEGTFPSWQTIRRFVSLLRGWSIQGVKVIFVHCKSGVSRTGILLVCALVVLEGHSSNDAVNVFSRARGYSLGKREKEYSDLLAVHRDK
eukprot:Trichotokara_eunicae@DN1768_c0_g1_i1.p1